MGKMDNISAKLGGKKPKNALKTFARLFSYYKECRVHLILALLFIALYSVAVIVASFLLKPLVEVLKTTGVAPEGGQQLPLFSNPEQYTPF